MIHAAVGIARVSKPFIIPAPGRLGEVLGVDSPYGIRNSREAESWLSDEILGIVLMSSETHGEVLHVGAVPYLEQAESAVQEAFLLRNGEALSQAASEGYSGSELVPISSIRPGEIPGGTSEPIAVNQPESALLLRYQDWLGRTLRTKSVQHPGSSSRLRVDAIDTSTGALIEAKASPNRTFVLHALAQLLDYGRLVPEHGRKIVLLPARPEDDLFELARSLEIEICFEAAGTFITNPVTGAVGDNLDTNG